jgi:hypothetical protein
MGDDIDSGLSSMSLCLHFCTTNMGSSVFGTRTSTGFYVITRVHHPLITQLNFFYTVISLVGHHLIRNPPKNP